MQHFQTSWTRLIELRQRRQRRTAMASFLGLNALDVLLTVTVLALGLHWASPSALTPVTLGFGVPGLIGVRAVSTAFSAGVLWQARPTWTQRGVKLLAAGMAVKLGLIAASAL
jgi:hypothetical protein